MTRGIPLEQALPELRLQAGDLLTDRGRREKASLCSTPEVPRVDDDEEGLEELQI